MGRKKGPPVPDQGLVVTGQAQITDMTPIRDLLKQADLLCVKVMAATSSIDSMVIQQTRVALAIENLANEISEHLKAVRAEMGGQRPRGRDRPPRSDCGRRHCPAA